MFRSLTMAFCCFTPLLLTLPAGAQQPVATPPGVAAEFRSGPAAGSQAQGVPRAERARARQECLSEHVALSGEDLRQAMRDCLQARFPQEQLYARDGVTRDGKPTMVAARAACKAEIDARGLAGAERRRALVDCFGGKRPDIAQRAECRKSARQQGLDGEMLRKALEACAREGRS